MSNAVWYHEVMTRHAATIIVIFGITGDLAKRKLVPALGHMAEEGFLEHTTIVGVSRRKMTAAEVLAESPFAEQLLPRLELFTMDLAEAAEYTRLKDRIDELRRGDGDTQTLFYLSVPPHAAVPIAELLGEAGLNDDEAKLLLEKPFGVDLSSAEEAVERIGRYYREDQLYRIDHYLAKEMVQNIIAFRSRNAIFRHLWSNKFIERIDIIASETIGIEGRASFYEQTGALRDVVQNHLMQLMALILMDVSEDMEVDDIPARRLRALESIEPIQADVFHERVRRGQYAGYAQEAGNPGSLTETFAALTLFSDDSRWQGVPIRLIAGKHLAEKTTEVRIYFRRTHMAESNRLVMHIQPKEGVEIDLVAKKPGYEKDYEQVALGFDYRAQATRPIEAYERVLVDALVSDKSLFTGAAEVREAWRILQPVQERWSFETDDLNVYPAGAAIETVAPQSE